MSDSNNPLVTTGLSQKPKADPSKRFIAAIIDSAIAFALCVIPLIGGIIGTIYMLLRDGLNYEFMDKRSIGKKLLKLRPVTIKGEEMDIVISFKRNWMLALGVMIMFLIIIPLFGWVLIPLIAVCFFVLGIIESFLILTKKDGRRWGDVLAGTIIIEEGERQDNLETVQPE
ncbi:MAG TPA: RDD family protein [bacterium]|nr:RDD family protein [bacterium]HPN42810.1 RDD family protein [bacterium]